MDGIDQFNAFLTLHKSQLLASAIPHHFWSVLYKKVVNQIFDAGETFSMLQVDYSDDIRTDKDPVYSVVVIKENGVKANNPNEIYLIDHAWTFRMDKARVQLEQIPGLASRMCGIMGIVEEEDDSVDTILEKIWRFSNMYMLNSENSTVESRMPIWYVMDELGAAINHSDYPNFRVVPFIYLNEQITYSLLFPIIDTDRGSPVSRNFVEGIGSSMNEKLALLLPWKVTDFSDENFNQEEPDPSYFLSGHIEESIPEVLVTEPVVDKNRQLKVFTEYELVREFLTDPLFEIVDDALESDVLWLTTHYKKFKELSEETPNRFVNQFPFEHVLTIKDLLSIVCRRGNNNSNEDSNIKNLDTLPKWLPTTYNMTTELVKFVSYYQNRAKNELDNHWICKPWNLARALDTHITNDLAYLMRLPPTGPKIAQKYIENPVLFDRQEVGGKVKFDIRYVILLKKTDPLEAYIYKNFFLRFANKPFELNQFDDYEKHFTVMNYSEFNLRHIPCAEFLQLWEEQYPNESWNDIETEICRMFNEIFVNATMKSPPCGIAHNPQSRALYAADIMLSWENGKIQPKLLEINWVPDCKRACDYYSEFFNDIFKLLFLNISNDNVFRHILK